MLLSRVFLGLAATTITDDIRRQIYLTGEYLLEGRGKSGGARVICYWMTDNDQLYMLLAYPKNVQDNLTDAQLKALKKIVERWSG